jgi:hypothetical protein
MRKESSGHGPGLERPEQRRLLPDALAKDSTGRNADRERSVEVRLAEALDMRLSKLKEVQWGTLEDLRRQWKSGELQEVKKAMEEALELVEWLPGERFSETQFGAYLQNEGFDYSSIDLSIREAYAPRRGRPSSDPALPIRAYELHFEGGKSWTQVAREVCPCRESTHTKYCSERIRQAVRRLQSLFRRLRV